MNKFLKDIKVVVFDLDDTLYLERDFSFSGFNFLEQKYNIPNFSSTAKSIYLSGQTQNIFNKTFETLNFSYTNDIIQLFIKDFREHIPNIQLCDDALSFFVFLKQHNIKTGIITDGFLISQKNKIEALNLVKMIDHIIITDSLDDTNSRAYWKPHPLAYMQIEEKFQVRSSECIYLGDNLKKDFITPEKRGWKHLLVTRKGAVHECDHHNYTFPKIQNFNELMY